VDTCFLFTRHLDNEGCFCCTITEKGEVKTPPAQRDFAQIKMLQQNCNTLIVETCTNASLFDLELPWLPERKARVAIPYALEDKLAQSFDELHFAFDKPRYQNNRYLVTVISKQRIAYIIQLLKERGIDFAAITLDWFALSAQELCVNESTVLINNDDFKGALSGELAIAYLKNHPHQPPLLFSDSQITADPDWPKTPENSYIWIAQRLLKAKIMNLCQGNIQLGNGFDLIKKGYQLAGVLCGGWLLSLVLVNAFNLHSLNKQIAEVDKKIALIYHEFFPDAKQVISPKFRISQLLSKNNSDNQPHLWFLLNQFAKQMKNDQFTLEQLRYQNNTLSVTLISPDFASLEELENQLKKLELKVKQTQASTQEQQVVATLELK